MPNVQRKKMQVYEFKHGMLFSAETLDELNERITKFEDEQMKEQVPGG